MRDELKAPFMAAAKRLREDGKTTVFNDQERMFTAGWDAAVAALKARKTVESDTLSELTRIGNYAAHLVRINPDHDRAEGAKRRLARRMLKGINSRIFALGGVPVTDPAEEE